MALQPYELLDDGFAPLASDILIVGCGNLLRGDDAVGPIAIRTMWNRGVADGVELVDGGTAGMDIAFKMRGVRRVILIDAAQTGSAPGTVFRIPGSELEELPDLGELHTHLFRWDHALAFGRWLLGPHFPSEVEVFLIEGEAFEPGADLTAAVRASMEKVVDLILADCGGATGGQP